MSQNEIKWQPVMMVINRRLECKCGALAIFVTGKINDTGEYNVLNEVDVWCQQCFVQSIEGNEDGE